MTPEEFRDLIAPITARIEGRPLDGQLEAQLNKDFPASGAAFSAIRQACEAAIAAGWMCEREGGGIKFGRVIKPGSATHGFSVDVVDMADVKGPPETLFYPLEDRYLSNKLVDLQFPKLILEYLLYLKKMQPWVNELK